MHFLDAPDLNAEVTGCTEHIVDISIETHVPHMKQHLSIPLSQVRMSEDFSHYTRARERSSTKSIDAGHQREAPTYHLLAMSD